MRVSCGWRPDRLRSVRGGEGMIKIVEREHRRFPEDLQDMLQQQARMKREQDADFEAWKARNPKKESAA